MAFQILFGDDEHTAAEGPYARLMKTRKWLYLSAGLAVLLSHGLYDEESAKAIIKVFSLPAQLVSTAIALGLFYLLVQYVLLAQQLWVTYGIVLNERLAYRRADELAKARANAEEARSALSAHMRQIQSDEESAVNNLRSAFETAQNNLRTIKNDQRFVENSGDPDVIANVNASVYAREVEADAALKAFGDFQTMLKLRRKASSEGIYQDDAVGQSRLSALKRAQKAVEDLAAADPAGKPGYRRGEKLIDLIRVGVPLIFAVIALATLLSTIQQWSPAP